MSNPKLSLRKAAARVGMAPTTFGAIVRAGRGPRYVRVGNVYQITGPDVDAWLAAHTVDSAQ